MSSRPEDEARSGDGKSDAAKDREAVIWLLADMVLVAGAMTALVKAQGLNYPSIQLIFIRATVGLFFILPLH